MVLNATTSARPKGLKLIFRTLRYRNYRLFFAGQCISLIGTWMQQIALSWLVYRLTHSVFLLGMVGFVSQFPTFLFAPFAGVLSDRWNRHHILIFTQSMSMLLAMTLAVLVLTGVIAVWHILLLTLFLGCVNALDIPTRQSFVIYMIDQREDLGNAIALNSAMFNGARFLGPSVAGLLIAAVGEGICFLLNGLSYLAVIAALLSMKLSPVHAESMKANMLHDFKEGLAYTFGSEPIRSILLLLALTSFMGVPYAVLMPAFARDILHGGPHTLGFLMSATGAGSLVWRCLSCIAKKYYRPGENHSNHSRHFWYGTHWIFSFPHLVALITSDVHCRLWHHGSGCIQQHAIADHCG